MKILRGAIITIVVLIALIVVGGFLLPAETRFSRSIVVQRPVDDMFLMLNGFNQFNRWSPWYDLDPATEYMFEGPASGVGAKMYWSSESPNVGKGSQEITQVQEPHRIDVALAFEGQDPALSWYELSENGEGTEVRWGFATDFGANPINRYFGLIIEGLIAPDYEKGLAKLKAYAESEDAEG